MGATEEQMNLVAGSGVDHVSYILILYRLAFLPFLFVNRLIHLYDRAANADTISSKPAANGHIRLDNRTGEEGRVRDAEEFELDGLMSEDEDEEQAQRRKLLSQDDGGLSSPSTIGRNSDRIA